MRKSTTTSTNDYNRRIIDINAMDEPTYKELNEWNRMMNMRRRNDVKNTFKNINWISVGPLEHYRRVYCRRVVVWWLYSNFKIFIQTLVHIIFQHDTLNLNRVHNGRAMVAKPGTIELIMKMASEVGQLLSCCCIKFLTSNDFEGRISAKPEVFMVG